MRRRTTAVGLLMTIVACEGNPEPIDRDERGVAGAVSHVLRAFVAEHTGVPPGRLVLDTTLQLIAHWGDPYSEAEPFPPEERDALADELDWEVSRFSDVVACEQRCLLPNNMIVFNLSRPTIRGDRAAVSFSWHHNYAGVIRENRRVVEMVRTRGQQWQAVDVLGCIRSTAGGPCELPSGG